MERIILNVDTGQDDAVAIMLAAASKAVKVEGIVALGGNQTLVKTLNNTLNLVEALDMDVKVYKGTDGPLIREQIIAGDVHGESGFDGPVFPKERKIQCSGYGIPYIVETVMANPNEITLVPVGPLTDIALALKMEPKLAQNIKKIVLMGGAIAGGNTTEYAEFNIFADPEAADIVFSSGVEIYMMGLDVTEKLCVTEQKLDVYKKRLENKYSRALEIFTQSMTCYAKALEKLCGELPCMHDPSCIVALSDESIFGFKKANIKVELKDKERYGQTCATFNESGNVHVALTVEKDAEFWSYLDRAFDVLK